MRVFVFCLGFNTEQMIRDAFDNFERTVTPHEQSRCIKTLVNPWFPGTSREALCSIASAYAWWGPVDIENRGVVENHNYCIHELAHMRKGDYYVTFDPDVRMQEPGWISAMIEALESDPNHVFCAAAREFHHEAWVGQQHGRRMRTLPSGLKVATYDKLIAWSMGIYKGEWLASRPRHFAAENPYYGYAEHCEYDRMVREKKTWCQVYDYHDHHMGADPQYTEWKRQSGAHQTKEKFEDWLKKR